MATSFTVLLPNARRGVLNADELEAAESKSTPDGPLTLAARGEPDVVLAIDVDGQAERKALDAPRCELELICMEAGNRCGFGVLIEQCPNKRAQRLGGVRF